MADMSPCILIVLAMPGGSVSDHAAMARVLRDNGCEVRIEGTCASACLTLLSSACVAPDARLIFHLPSTDTAYWREVMTRDWPLVFQDWYRALPPGTGPRQVTGAEAIRVGVPAC